MRCISLEVYCIQIILQILAQFGIISFFLSFRNQMKSSLIFHFISTVRWFGVFYEVIYLIPYFQFWVLQFSHVAAIPSPFTSRQYDVVNRQRTFPIHFILMKQIKIHHSIIFSWNGGIKMKTRLLLTKLCII